MNRIKLKTVLINICSACLNGEGEECHTPGCIFRMDDVPNPIDPRLYTVFEETDIYDADFNRRPKRKSPKRDIADPLGLDDDVPF